MIMQLRRWLLHHWSAYRDRAALRAALLSALTPLLPGPGQESRSIGEALDAIAAAGTGVA